MACNGTIIFNCIPIQAAWDTSLRPPPFGVGDAQCFSMDTFRNIGLTNSSKFLLIIYSMTSCLIIHSYQLSHGPDLCHNANPADLETSTQHTRESFANNCFESWLFVNSFASPYSSRVLLIPF